MSLYRRKDSSVWWMSIMDEHGHRIRKSTGTADKGLAKTMEADEVKAAYERKLFGYEAKGTKVTFEELWSKYKLKYEKKRDPCTIKRLLPFFGDYVLLDITGDMIEDYILSRIDEAKPATIYQEYALGRRMFNVARKKWKWIRNNPWTDVEFGELAAINNERERYLRIKEEKVLLANASPPYLADIIVFAIHTGCRRGEILTCEWRKNIDMQRRLVTLQASKGGKRKTIPMSETLYDKLLKRSKVRNISGRVFPYAIEAVKDSFKRAVRKSGIEGLRFHDLRHTFATRLVQAGVDLYAVKQMLGHRSIKTTERYAHHAPGSLRPSVKALDDCYLGIPCHDPVTEGDVCGCYDGRKSFNI